MFVKDVASNADTPRVIADLSSPVVVVNEWTGTARGKLPAVG